VPIRRRANAQRRPTSVSAARSLPVQMLYSRCPWSDGQRSLGAVLHSSDEPGELSQRVCHYSVDAVLSTNNIIIIIIIISSSSR